MKLKKEYLILLLIIVALSIYLAVHTQNQTHFELPRPAQADTQKINRILITKGANAVELTRQDDKWSIGPKGYPADNVKVRNMVKAAADLSITDLISESGNYERYDLTDDKKINVQAFEGKDRVRNFDVGRMAPTYQHTFTRLGDDPRVYQARGHLNETFNQTVDQLRDRTVLSFEKSDLTGLVIQKGPRSLTLTQKELAPATKTPAAADKEKNTAQQPESKPAPPQHQWQDPEGQAVDQPTVQRLVDDLADFKCSSYMSDNAAETLKDPVWTLTFKSAKGEHSLSVFNKKDAETTDYPARSSDSAYAFLVYKSRVESIEKQVDKLLNPAPKTQAPPKDKASAKPMAASKAKKQVP
jgi:Domain of unknown function (DUF4340)